ncbi:MAG: hypothetical protein BWY75_00517 [bacterium ADurb.Bin425]|nr:MAG: hypothetical protein BWY75_00517 [bacterium ADurb.Bin425]
MPFPIAVDTGTKDGIYAQENWPYPQIFAKAPGGSGSFRDTPLPTGGYGAPG